MQAIQSLESQLHKTVSTTYCAKYCVYRRMF